VTRYLSVLMALCLLAACDVPATVTPVAAVPTEVSDELVGRDAARRAFVQVQTALEPVAERECRFRTNGVNCDFRIVLDPDTKAPSNAFQTEDKTGRPIIIFTLALLEDARNVDEIAFVMAHEAAHHIEGHLDRQRRNAALGAVIFSGIATRNGATAADVKRAGELGAAVGARSYSKDFELEADELGTIIAARAGFSPVRGAAFFNRIPDPGDRFLGTHPPNAERIAIVQKTAARL
jgi:predicted Zn-dependent protease